MCFIKKRKKIALVLGSGGARGLAHIGVIKTLVKYKVPIDLIIGSSSGALIGALFAQTGEVESVENIVNELTHKDIARVLLDPSWKGGLIKGEKTLETLKKYFSNKKIEDLKIPFFAVATDLLTAKEVVFSKGDVAEAVRASISIPLIYNPVLFENRTLVDGGVSCPVPVEVALDKGAEKIIAVNLDGVYFSEKKESINRLNSTIEILKDSYFALRYNLAKKEVRAADVVIEPEMKFVGSFDFIGGKEAIMAGEKATEKKMREIRRLF